MAGDPSDPAEAARLRRQRLLRRAMENMGTLTPARVSTPAAPQQGSAPRPPDEAPRADEQQLATLIETRFQEISARGKDHFALLGVSRQATRDQVRQAFINLAKVFHPDRLPPALSHLAPKITAVFEAVRDAYDVLMDDGKRAAYLMSLEKPAAAKANPQTATEALEHFKRGEVYFKKRDYLAAEASYERAYALDPKATYMAAKAWTIYMDPARKADAPLAKQMMLDAVKQEPSCDRAHYQLGVIARVENDMDRAERHFRDAVRANPKHLEANQELRLIEMRRRGPPPKKGFFR